MTGFGVENSVTMADIKLAKVKAELEDDELIISIIEPKAETEDDEASEDGGDVATSEV